MSESDGEGGTEIAVSADDAVELMTLLERLAAAGFLSRVCDPEDPGHHVAKSKKA